VISSAQIFRNLHAQALAAGQKAPAPAEGKAAAETGQVMGYRLTAMADPAAKLADSMEELSMLFEEKEMKTVGERKLGQAHGRNANLLRAIQAWQGVLLDVPKVSAQIAILAHLKKAFEDGRKVSADDLLARLEEESDEPTHQFAMLDAMRQGCGEGERDLRDLFDAAREKLMQSKGEEVRAGLNIAETVNKTAGNPDEMRDLRALYRGEILGFKSPQHCFRSLLATRGAGRLDESLDFLVESCGIDLESATPSQSPEELRRILLDLQSVQVLKTVMGRFGTLNARLEKSYGEKGLLNDEQLTGRLMDLTEAPFVSKDDVSGLVGACSFAKLAPQVYFTTELLGISRTLSPRLFGEGGDRFKLVDACQEHLDSLVDALTPEDKAAYEAALEQMGEEG